MALYRFTKNCCLSTRLILKQIILLYVVTFMGLLPLLCFNQPNTWYFRMFTWTNVNATQVVTEMNNKRLADARHYFQSHPLPALRQPRSRYTNQKTTPRTLEQKDFVIGVITVPRVNKEYETYYLTQILASLSQIVENSHNTLVFICDTFAGPGQHTEAEGLAQYFQKYTRFPNGSTPHVTLLNYIKEKQDYIYCLEKALQYKSKYIVMMQDDALPDVDFLYHVNHILNGAKFGYDGVQYKHDNQLGFIKLYYPEKWQGFSTDYKSIVELSGWGTLSAIMFTIIIKQLIGRARLFTMNTALGALYGVLVASAIGRPHLLQMRRLSSQLLIIRKAPDCCIPAQLYTHTSAELILNDLTAQLKEEPNSEIHLDIIVDDIMDTNNLRGYLVEPNLVKHIGFVSSLKGLSKHLEHFV